MRVSCPNTAFRNNYEFVVVFVKTFGNDLVDNDCRVFDFVKSNV